MRFLPANAQHTGDRSSQQDSFGFSNPDDTAFAAHGGFVAIVADGMGGMSHGGAASKLAVKTFLDKYAAKTETESVPAALERSVRACNEAVYALAVREGAPGDVGTTLIAVSLKHDGLHWISVGDSAIYLVRQGTLTLLTTNHVYGRRLDARAARGEITAEQAANDPQREALTSYVGTPELKEIDRNLRPMPIASGDYLLLATDGLFKTLDDSEILATFLADPEHAPDHLVVQTIARHRHHQDNVTVCTVSIAAEPGAPTVVPPAPAKPAQPPAAVTVKLADRADVSDSGWTPNPLPEPPSTGVRRTFLIAACLIFVLMAAGLAWRFDLYKPSPPQNVTQEGRRTTRGTLRRFLRDR